MGGGGTYATLGAALQQHNLFRYSRHQQATFYSYHQHCNRRSAITGTNSVTGGGGGRGSFIGRGEMPHGKGCTQFPHWRHLCWYSRQPPALLSHCNHQCCNTIPTLVQPPTAVTLSPPPMQPLPHFTTVQLTPTQLPCCCHLSCCHADFTGSYAVSSTSFKLLLAQS